MNRPDPFTTYLNLRTEHEPNITLEQVRQEFDALYEAIVIRLQREAVFAPHHRFDFSL